MNIFWGNLATQLQRSTVTLDTNDNPLGAQKPITEQTDS